MKYGCIRLEVNSIEIEDSKKGLELLVKVSYYSISLSYLQSKVSCSLFNTPISMGISASSVVG